LQVRGVVGPLDSSDVGLPTAVEAAGAVTIAPAVVTATVLVVAAVVLAAVVLFVAAVVASIPRGAFPALPVTAAVTSRVPVGLGMIMVGTARICRNRGDAGTGDGQRSGEQSRTRCHA
jgi:hypothetical protein